MKTKTLSAIFTFATLTAIAGSAVAGPHDGYSQAFYDAYQRTLGEGTASPALVETKGKAAYGTTSGPDGNANYHSIFVSN